MYSPSFCCTGPSQQSWYAPSYGAGPVLELPEPSPVEGSPDSDPLLELLPPELDPSSSSGGCVVELDELAAEVTVGGSGGPELELDASSSSSSAAAIVGGSSVKQPASASAAIHRAWCMVRSYERVSPTRRLPRHTER
jgi:hypothetical protein